MSYFKKIAAASVLVLCAAAAFAGGTRESASASVRIALLPDVDSIPFVVADINGYYAEEGVDVELLQFKNPVDRDAAFQAKEADGAISDILAAAFAINGGFGVSATSMSNGSYKLLVAPDSDVSDIAGLRGKRLGISRNTIIEYATDRMLASGGLSADDIVKEVVPQIPVRLELLSRGKLDGATLAEPLASISVMSGCSVLNSTDKLGINPGIVMFRDDVLKSRPEDIKSVYRAYNKAVEYINNTPESDYILKVNSIMGFPEGSEKVMTLPAYRKASAPDKKEIEDVVQWLMEKDLIDSYISYENMVDVSCLP